MITLKLFVMISPSLSSFVRQLNNTIKYKHINLLNIPIIINNIPADI